MATSKAAAVATEKVKEPSSGTTPRGAFIVLEGLDRSGKTTQVKLLEKRFTEAGKSVQLMRFPGTFFKRPRFVHFEAGTERAGEGCECWC